MRHDSITHAHLLSLPETTLDITIPYKRPAEPSRKQFRVEVIKPWLLEVWEPLSTKVPNPNLALAYCCYLNTVIWYVRPYTVRPWHHLWTTDHRSTCIPRIGCVWHAEKPGSHLEEWGREDYHLTWDVRFTYNGTDFDAGGGSVEYLGKGLGWWMKHYARRRKAA